MTDDFRDWELSVLNDIENPQNLISWYMSNDKIGTKLINHLVRLKSHNTIFINENIEIEELTALLFSFEDSSLPILVVIRVPQYMKSQRGDGCSNIKDFEYLLRIVNFLGYGIITADSRQSEFKIPQVLIFSRNIYFQCDLPQSLFDHQVEVRYLDEKLKVEEPEITITVDSSKNTKGWIW